VEGIRIGYEGKHAEDRQHRSINMVKSVKIKALISNNYKQVY